MSRRLRSAVLPLLLLLAVLPCPGLAVAARGQEPAEALDVLAARLVGEWVGEGTYEGNVLSLTRSWTRALDGRFLEADMRVTMPGGQEFGALMYWTPAGGNVWRVVWMDGTGRLQIERALGDPATGRVEMHYLDERTGSRPEWRRWEFEVTGRDAYRERLHARVDGAWELLAEFAFRRSGPGR